MLSIAQCYQLRNVINCAMLSNAQCYQLLNVIDCSMLSVAQCYQLLNFISLDLAQNDYSMWFLLFHLSMLTINFQVKFIVRKAKKGT
jgi:hypothetical protein